MSDNEIRRLRLRRAWSQEQLAAEAGISTEAVNRLESDDQLNAVLAILLSTRPINTKEWTEDYLRLMGPIVDRIDPDRLPAVLGEVMAELARAGDSSSPGTITKLGIIGDINIDHT